MEKKYTGRITLHRIGKNENWEGICFPKITNYFHQKTEIFSVLFWLFDLFEHQEWNTAPSKWHQVFNTELLVTFSIFLSHKTTKSNWENNIRQYRQKYHLIQWKDELSEKENLYLLSINKNGSSCEIIWMPTEVCLFVVAVTVLFSFYSLLDLGFHVSWANA